MASSSSTELYRPDATELRERLQHKKQEMGDNTRYGFDLKPPYSKEEIESHYDPAHIQVPDDLIWYLTNISREILAGSYPTVFSLDCLSALKRISREDYERLRIPDNLNYICYGEWGVDTSTANSDNDNDRKWGSRAPGIFMARVADDGCAFFDAIYLGGGAHHGTIWCYGDDDCWGQKKYWGKEIKGEANGKSMTPFMEYIVRDAYGHC
jgi:hypothetical protein